MRAEEPEGNHRQRRPGKREFPTRPAGGAMGASPEAPGGQLSPPPRSARRERAVSVIY